MPTITLHLNLNIISCYYLIALVIGNLIDFGAEKDFQSFTKTPGTAHVNKISTPKWACLKLNIVCLMRVSNFEYEFDFWSS